MVSQQNAIAQRLFQDMDLPGHTGPTNTKASSNGTITRAYEAEYALIYQEWLSSVILNLFTYEGLPKTVNWHYLEYLLRSQSGYAAVGQNQSGQFVVINEIAEPTINQYGDYNSAPGTGVWQKIFKKVNSRDLQPIYTSTPSEGDYAVFINKYSFSQFFTMDSRIIARYAKDLAEIRAIMQYNLVFQKTPVVFMGERGSIEADNIWDKIVGGDTLIKVSEKSNVSQIKTIDLKVPLIQAELKDAWNGLLSEFLTQFGINTVGVDKKERVLKAEAAGNNQLTMSSLNAYIEPRRQALDLLNKRFDLHAEVHLNTNAVDDITKAMMTDDQSGLPEVMSNATPNGDAKESGDE